MFILYYIIVYARELYIMQYIYIYMFTSSSTADAGFARKNGINIRKLADCTKL